MFFFFFQAEDGLRDFHVTGVQTCALPIYRIEALPRLVGQTVAVRGWVMTTRSSGKIAFVVVRDGTGYLQAVLSKKDVSDAAWDAFGKLTQETSVEVTGTVRADPRAPGGGGA